MDTKTWLKQCEEWTDRDHELFEIGISSGTAIHPKTGKPYTMKEIKELMELLPY
jgi:hypothetical protein